MVRPRIQLLSRDLILDAALEQIENKHDFTIIGLAGSLKVNPSSLYHHFPGGKDDILDGLRERIIETSDGPGSETSDWRAELGTWIRSSRDSLARFPAAIPLMMGRVVADQTTLQLYERLAAIVSNAGVPANKMLHVMSMVEAVVFGSAVDSFSPDPAWRPDAKLQPNLFRALTEASGGNRVDAALEMGLLVIIRFVESLAAPNALDVKP